MIALKIQGKIAVGIILHSGIIGVQRIEHLLLVVFAEIQISGLLMFMQEIGELRCRLHGFLSHKVIELLRSIYAYLIEFIHLDIRTELHRSRRVVLYGNDVLADGLFLFGLCVVFVEVNHSEIVDVICHSC